MSVRRSEQRVSPAPDENTDPDPPSGRRGGLLGGLGRGFIGGGEDAGFAGRDEALGSTDRSWIDRLADDEVAGRGHYRGRGPRNWSRDDQQVYEAVCERLLHDPLIDARGIEVVVDHGVVTLKGEVRGAADPALAERLVRATPGVKGVELDLKLRPRPREPAWPVDEGRIDKSSLVSPILPR